MNTKKSLAYQVSDEQFKAIIMTSTSCAHAMRLLGFKCIAGNANRRVKQRIKELNLDTSH